MDLERSTDRERRWPAWAGTKDELKRIGHAVEEEVERHRSSKFAEHDAETSKILSDPKLDGLHKEVEEKVRRRDRDALAERLSTEAKLVEGDNSTKGDVEEVLQELDRRNIMSIRFSMKDYDERIDVELKKEGYESGAKLRVASKDRGWANQVFIRLSEEIEKGVPGWSWLRRQAGRGVIALLSTLTPLIAINVALIPNLSKSGKEVLYALDPTPFIIGFILLTLSDRFHSWLFPRLEITSEGSPNTGSRRLAWAGGLVLTVVLGVIVNLIS